MAAARPQHRGNEDPHGTIDSHAVIRCPGATACVKPTTRPAAWLTGTVQFGPPDSVRHYEVDGQAIRRSKADYSFGYDALKDHVVRGHLHGVLGPGIVGAPPLVRKWRKPRRRLLRHHSRQRTALD